MSNYTAPVNDYLLLLRHVLDYERTITTLPSHSEATLELVAAVVEEGARIAQELIAPLNRSGDEEGCSWNNGTVRTPSGFKEAYCRYRNGGWTGLTASAEFGGQELPRVIGLILREIISGANSSFGTYLGLSQSAYSAISAHARDDLKKLFLPPLVEGRWMGTMCLTEPHCGSDLGLLKAQATPGPDGLYRISGTKIFVTGGEHDMAENIVHMVLARLPNAPSGTKGISLFAVPKMLAGPEEHWNVPNHVECTGIEHKMGIRGSATATLSFDGAAGWLIGEQHQGLAAMFVMMNSSRLGVSVQAVGIAEAALQAGRRYALERHQGRIPSSNTAAGPVPIISHPDVRRNLLVGKSFVEGARALWLWAGILLDQHYNHPDATTRANAEGLLALLTPVFKAFFSDRSCQATAAAMQVFGGHGYIRESGVEQYVRDGRIIPLYEGTNGIQSLDLISRKIRLNDGKAVNMFFRLVEHEIEELLPQRQDLARKLDEALARLKSATQYVQDTARDDPYSNGAGGHDYLQLFGLTAMGFAWAKIANASIRLFESHDAAWARTKLKVADYFFFKVLPESDSHYQALITGSEPLMALQPEEI